MIICGDASDSKLLQEEGIERMDAFVSLTNFDERKYHAFFVCPSGIEGKADYEGQ